MNYKAILLLQGIITQLENLFHDASNYLLQDPQSYLLCSYFQEKGKKIPPLM